MCLFLLIFLLNRKRIISLIPGVPSIPLHLGNRDREMQKLLLFCVWQNLPLLDSVQASSIWSHRKEALLLLPVWQEVYSKGKSQSTPAHSHRREAVPLHSVWQELYFYGSIKDTPVHSHERALTMRFVKQELHLIAGRTLKGKDVFVLLFIICKSI